MAIYMYMHNGHRYRMADTVTIAQVNAALNSAADRFVEVPLPPGGWMPPAGGGGRITRLFITPASVSHFAQTDD